MDPVRETKKTSDEQKKKNDVQITGPHAYECNNAQ